MGKLKKELEGHFFMDEVGSEFFTTFEVALDARNYLCHGFFKDFLAQQAGLCSEQAALDKLEDIKSQIRIATNYSGSIVSSLQENFPRVFDEVHLSVH
ncbi:hypothetical protein [Roseivivax halodurans]|uniref:hypothetical protein n=1 Tax=Roseivivax halodurans TaxID=93683 RepID=UPI0012FB7E9E|nr:hypothetical protein [Roseivivax halodurans]